MGTFLSFRAYNTDNQLIIHSAAKFRFHKGTIKTGLILFLCYLILYFNSIKVQLKLAGCKIEVSLHGFQFHKGTIKTALPIEDEAKPLYFNSIKVQLKLPCR